jgi:hypothetical protein
VEVDRTTVVVAPGGTETVRVRLHNRTRSDIRAEVQLASPYGSWDWVKDGVRGIEVPADGTSEVAVDVAPPADTPPGHSWLMAKVMWFGRAQYAETVRLEVAP